MKWQSSLEYSSHTHTHTRCGFTFGALVHPAAVSLLLLICQIYRTVRMFSLRQITVWFKAQWCRWGSEDWPRLLLTNAGSLQDFQEGLLTSCSQRPERSLQGPEESQPQHQAWYANQFSTIAIFGRQPHGCAWSGCDGTYLFSNK